MRSYNCRGSGGPSTESREGGGEVGYPEARRLEKLSEVGVGNEGSRNSRIRRRGVGQDKANVTTNDTWKCRERLSSETVQIPRTTLEHPLVRSILTLCATCLHPLESNLSNCHPLTAKHGLGSTAGQVRWSPTLCPSSCLQSSVFSRCLLPEKIRRQRTPTL